MNSFFSGRTALPPAFGSPSPKNRRRGGYNVIELVFVMALLAVFGVTTYLLIAVGGNTYQRVMHTRDQNADMRVVLSYITTRVRQNDTLDAVRVVSTDSGPMLSISQLLGDGEEYETRIYCHEGKLYEDLVVAGTPYEPEFHFELTPADSLELDYSLEPELDCASLKVTVYMSGETEKSLSTVLKVRSADAEVA